MVKQVPETNQGLSGVIRVHLSLGEIAKKELSLIFATFFYLGFYRIMLLPGGLLCLISPPLTFPCQSPSSLAFCGWLVDSLVWSFGFFFMFAEKYYSMRSIFLMGQLRPVGRQWLCRWRTEPSPRTSNRLRESACCRAGVGHGSTCWGAGCSGLLVKKDTGAQMEPTHMAEQSC